MKISSFSRMMPFRKNGRLTVILKLVLPSLSPEELCAETFNSLYVSLAEEYRALCANISERAELIRPATVTVSFEEITDKYVKDFPKLCNGCKKPLAIRRVTRINMDGDVKLTEHTDLFDAERGIFVK